jgi:YaiO family outer membrane protein
MRLALAAGLLALSVGAAHAQTPDAYTRGVELRTSGRAAEAIPHLEAAAKASPQDADVWLNLGLARSATQDYAGAEQAFDEALRLAPDYSDVEIARARLAYFRNDPTEAERRLAPVLARDPTNAEARELRGRLTGAGTETSPPWRLDASVSHADLSGGLPSARRASLFLGRTLSNGVAVIGGIEQVRQFGLDDTYLEMQVATRRGYLAFGGTPNADFRPEWAVRGGVYADPWTLFGGWTAQFAADGAWSRYPVGDVRALTPSLTLARGDALSLTARWVNTLDERDDYRSGYAVRAAWRPASRLQLSAGWADAPESTEGVTQDVQAVSLGAAFDIDARTTVRLDGVREDRPAYRRNELSFGLTRRF